jgi:ATP-dependent DNA helicase PIF1
VNAQVILLKNLNIEDELVNGSRGVVVGFDNNDDPKDPLLPRVLFDNGKTRTIGRTRYSTVIGQDEMCAREMLPLNLAWAMSIHKAQGMTISRLEIDLKRIWEDGQAYVALSRATSLDGLRLLNPVEPRIVRANSGVVEFYKTLVN